MKRVPIAAINRAISDISRALKYLEKTRQYAIHEVVDCNAQFLESIQRLEMAALAMRNEALACTQTTKERSDILKSTVDTLNIRVSVTTEGYLYVRVPCTLPSKKKSPSTEFITQPLLLLLSSIPNIPFSSELQTLVLCHNYNKNMPEALIRDHDNFETKKITDVVAAFCMPDDSIKYCDRLYLSNPTDDPCTEIWVIPSAKLSDWLTKNNPHKNSKNNPV